MKFELVPILDIMEELYKKPISPERFQEYISKLQGETKGDLSVPIGGFNPMAKAHVLDKIQELKALDAEKLIHEILAELNSKVKDSGSNTIQLVLNLADDEKGGWTNHYTTDFDSKFKLNALVTRDFCTPYFWTSETYSEALIVNRSLNYAYRTIYWMTHQKPVSLQGFLNQEIFVCNQMSTTPKSHNPLAFENIQNFHEKNKDEDDYSKLFNFFYGDEASESLSYPSYGINEMDGFEYASILASRNN